MEQTFKKLEKYAYNYVDKEHEMTNIYRDRREIEK